MSTKKVLAGTSVELPEIKAGFPSPAQDYVENGIDLNRELVKNPSSTFFGRARGSSMEGAGIYDGDLLIIDKSLEPREGALAVCFIDGAVTLKQIHFERDGNSVVAVWLQPHNESFQPIKVTEENQFIIWGIVTHSIRNF